MIRVLESVDAPGETTKYIDQVVREAPADIDFKYFNWRTALIGRFDVFHVHWPEFLVRSRHQWGRLVQRTLFRLFLLRLKCSKRPVVRTQHNLEPHERGDAAERRLLAALDSLTTVKVNISAAASTDDSAVTVLHGHYRDQFAKYPKRDSIPGRFVFFGRIEPYKGVPELIDTFSSAADRGSELRVVGRPAPSVSNEISNRVGTWSRDDVAFTARLETVSDADMVDEISRAESLILPYREMHNSGVLLVALSLGRPAIVPRSDANQAISDEVGSGWVVMYDGDLTPEVLRSSITELRQTRRAAPRLEQRDWGTVAAGYAGVFRKTHSRRARGSRPRVYVNVGGQRDNIGDSLLRRAYLDSLRPLGEIHAYVGPDAGYTSGLGLQPLDRAYVSPVKWLAAAAFSTLVRNRTVIAFNTGEVVGTSEEKRKGAWQGPLALLAKVRRRTIIVAGVSVRPGTAPARTSLRTLSRHATMLTWRDEWSRDQFELGTVQPDWAFGLGSEDPIDRTLRTRIAITMRGDRPLPSSEWVAEVRKLLTETGARPLVIVQVRRDTDRARELASIFDAELLEWPDERDHAAHEEALRIAYRSCVAVIADRIHALIVGATEGAVPLGFSTGSAEKVVRSLSPVFEGVPFFAYEHGDASRNWLRAIEQHPEVIVQIESARSQLMEVADRMRVAGGRG